MSEAVRHDDGRGRIEALLSVHRYDEAVRLADAMVARRPDDATAHALRAQCLLGMQRYDDALESADRAVGLAPDREWCHRLRAVALRKLNRPAEAIAAASESVRLAPYLAAAHQTLSHSYRQAKQGDAAWGAAMQAVTLEPADPDSHEAAGMAALELGRYDNAEHGFRTQLQLDPNSTYALNNLGVTLERTGRKAEAMELYQRAAQLEPREQLFRRNVGRLAYAQSTYRVVFLVALFVGVLVAGPAGLAGAIALLFVLYRVQKRRVSRIARDPDRAGQLGVETAKLEAMKPGRLFAPAQGVARSQLVWLVVASLGLTIAGLALADPGGLADRGNLVVALFGAILLVVGITRMFQLARRR